MDLSGILRPLVLLCILAAAAVTDALENKVYNILTGVGMICELLIFAVFPYAAEAEALMYECAFIAVLIVFFCLRKLGGADVKLYMLTVLAYPDSYGLDIIVYSVLAAGIYALCMNMMSSCRQRQPGHGIAMGVFIFLGAVTRLIWQH